MQSDSVPAQRLCILNFHGLGEGPVGLPSTEKNFWVDPRLFIEILDAVGGRRDVQLTFDDGNLSDFTIALPELLKRNLKGWFFIVADRLGREGFLTSEQIQAMVAEGMAVESHGMRHMNWMTLDRTELEQELVVARDILQQVTGRPITEVACPFGGYNRHVLSQLRRNGYTKIYTSDGGASSANSWIQPRNTIMRSYGLPRVLEICGDTLSGRTDYWRRLKLAAKRWR